MQFSMSPVCLNNVSDWSKPKETSEGLRAPYQLELEQLQYLNFPYYLWTINLDLVELHFNHQYILPYVPCLF